MPLIQGGPPEWIWERTPEVLKWEIITSDRPDGQTFYGRCFRHLYVSHPL